MSVAKRGEYYWMAFMFNGNRVQKSTKTKNKREAEEIERAYRTQLVKGEVGIEKKKEVPSFSQAVKEFLSWSQNEHREKYNTHRAYEVSCKSLSVFFKERKLNQIEPQDVEKYKIWRASQKPQNIKLPSSKAKNKSTIAGATVNRELACLKLIFNRYINFEILTKNPVSKVKFFKENTERWCVISREDEQKYLMVASQPLQDIAVLILETGCRPEELFRLERKNVDLEGGSIFIPFGKTPNAKRLIPLSNRAIRVLTKWLSESEGRYVFINPKTGKPITTLKKSHYSAMKRGGLGHFRLYDLRHSFASRFVESGGDLITLKDLLGHASLSMVLRYAHPSQEHRFSAIKKMEENYSFVYSNLIETDASEYVS
jgi:integrase